MSVTVEHPNIRLVTGKAAMLAIAPMLLELRPRYSADSLVARIEQQQASDGYQVACLFLDNVPA